MKTAHPSVTLVSLAFACLAMLACSGDDSSPGAVNVGAGGSLGSGGSLEAGAPEASLGSGGADAAATADGSSDAGADATDSATSLGTDSGTGGSSNTCGTVTSLTHFDNSVISSYLSPDGGLPSLQ